VAGHLLIEIVDAAKRIDKSPLKNEKSFSAYPRAKCAKAIHLRFDNSWVGLRISNVSWHRRPISRARSQSLGVITSE
jgi:hypothetical protein